MIYAVVVCSSWWDTAPQTEMLRKKMSGPFSLTVYSDKAIVIQQLDDESRKL